MVRGSLGKLASRALSVAGRWQHQQLRRLNIHEHQGAELMGKYGINVPKGAAAGSVQEVKDALKNMFPSEKRFIGPPTTAAASHPRSAYGAAREVTRRSSIERKLGGGPPTTAAASRPRSAVTHALCTPRRVTKPIHNHPQALPLADLPLPDRWWLPEQRDEELREAEAADSSRAATDPATSPSSHPRAPGEGDEQPTRSTRGRRASHPEATHSGH